MGVSDNVEQLRTSEAEAAGIEHHYKHLISERFHAVAFWFLIVALLGVCAGVGLAFKYHAAQLDKTVQIGSFVHRDVVYEIRPRGLK